MKQVEEIVEIIKKYNLGAINGGFYAPNIPDSVKQSITKNVDGYIFSDGIVASFDTTLRGKSCKNGLFFTVSGLYILEMLEKPVYVNYSDIDSVEVFADKKGKVYSGGSKLRINLKNTSSIRVMNGGIKGKANLCEMLKELIEYSKTWSVSSFEKNSGKVEKIPLDPKVKKKCGAIIHVASLACGGVGSGMAQIPLSDTAVITPIQIGMIISLASVFGLKITKEFAGALLKGFTASFVGRGISQVLIGWIPGLGNVVNTATAAGLTEAIGWAVVKEFYNDEIANRAKFSLEGQKKGYRYASAEYENKLKIQAELFETQQRDIKKELDAYDELLNDYENYIKELESKADLSDGDRKSLEEFKTDFERLKSLK